MSLLLRISIASRSYARKLGLIPYLSKLRGVAQRLLGGDGYEASFDNAMFDAICPGDVVWDVGANLGLYTRRFADAVGSDGFVVAIEPVPACFEELRRVTAGHSNVDCLQMALGSTTGALKMTLSDDPLGATHSLAVSEGKDSVQVRVATGSSLLEDEKVRPPHVVKIDVEGFEDEVIRGFERVLDDRTCRAIFIEVHFSLLEAKGAPHAPVEIVERLESRGFRVRWTDASHLAALR